MGKRVPKDYLQGACQRIEGALKNINKCTNTKRY
jgi:hypothetical protein